MKKKKKRSAITRKPLTPLSPTEDREDIAAMESIITAMEPAPFENPLKHCTEAANPEFSTIATIAERAYQAVLTAPENSELSGRDPVVVEKEAVAASVRATDYLKDPSDLDRLLPRMRLG